MTGKSIAVAVAILLAASAASGQEVIGARRTEIDTAIFGGGVMFTPSPNVGDPQSGSYVLSGAVTRNINRWIGMEGDLGWAMGRRQALAFYGAAPPDQKTPNMLVYSGNLVYNPGGRDRAVVPYAEAGLGALTVLSAPDTVNFGLSANSTHATANFGGGIRWFPIAHWGVRGDYRYMTIRGADAPARVGQQEVRSAHRLYGAVVLTF